MEKIYLSQSDFLPSERMNVDACESVLYRRNGIVYKFLLPCCRDGRDEIISSIYDDPLINTTIPLKLIEDPFEEKFVGYSMEELIGYINLREYLLSNCSDNDYQTRKEIALELISALRYLKSKGYLHLDISRKNIMIGNNNGRICDIDCMTNPSRGIKRYTWFDENESMEVGLMDAVGCIILNHSKHNLRAERKFSRDKIVSTIIASRSSLLLPKLYRDGFRAEDIYDHLSESLVEKYKSLSKS